MEPFQHSNEIEKLLAQFPITIIEKIMNTVAEGIMITDAERKIVYVNPSFEQITGYEWREVIGQSPSVLHSGVNSSLFYQDMWEMIEMYGEWKGEIWNQRKTGELYPEWLHIIEIRDALDNVTYYCGIFIDATGHEGTLRNLRDASLLDSLTKVGNRRAFMERMETLLTNSSPTEQMHAVLFLDLNRFKQINDTLGHAVGDELLKEFARRLNKLLKSEDIIARLGGDEFVITLTNLSNEKEAAIFADRIIDRLDRPLHIGSYELYLSTSIGISLYPKDGTSKEALLNKSDLAMYESKKSGQNNYVFYNDRFEGNTKQTIELEQVLIDTLESKSFWLLYEPKIELSTGEIVGLEAHLQCDVCEKKLHGLTDIIHIADEVGLLVPITEETIRLVCEDLQVEHEDLKWPHPITITIPAIYFMQPTFEEKVYELLEPYRVRPSQIEFQIAESTLMADRARAHTKLQNLKDVGFQITMHQFGKGFTSLSHLAQLPFDRVKIDESIVEQLCMSSHTQQLTQLCVQIAHQLGKCCEAPKIDEVKQLDIIKQLQIDVIQGVQAHMPMKMEQYRRQYDVLGE